MITCTKQRCIFCGRQKCSADFYYRNSFIGICQACFEALDFVPKPFSLEGTANINYLISPFFYSNKLREVIIDFKFHDNPAYGEILSHIMCDVLKDAEALDGFDFLIPVPLSEKRFNERGFNQSEILARPLAKQLGLPLRADILKRVRHTKRQSRLGAEERVSNVSGAFRSEEGLFDRRILLFDDIFTTGNTLNSCAEALRKSGAPFVAAATLAFNPRLENIFGRMY